MAVGALATVSVIALLRALFASESTPKGGGKRTVDYRPVQEYLLADASLRQRSVVNLLLSTSFGLNSVLYQVWLGFTVGVWALVAQGAWALSFRLLAPYAGVIRKYKSLHHLLGEHFGGATRVVGASLSVIGLVYLMTWEVQIGKATLSGMLTDSGLSKPQGELAGTWLIAGVMAVCLIYTVLAGLRGNATVDATLNAVKLIVVTGLTVMLVWRFFQPTNVPFWDAVSTLKSAMFPPLASVYEKLGYMGLLTNIVFSAAWQFVDTSSWQSVIAGDEAKEGQGERNLRLSGIVVFIAPGIIGTLLGISLAGTPGVTDANILSKAITLVPALWNLVPFAALVTIFACVLSLIDGLLLATALTFVVDIFYRRRRLEDLDSNPEHGETALLGARLIVIAIAIVGIWIIPFIVASLGIDRVFDYVYVIIIPQLALFGPVIAALRWDRDFRVGAWLPMIVAAAAGFAAVYVGGVLEQRWVTDAGGCVTVAVSYLGCWLVSKERPKSASPCHA